MAKKVQTTVDFLVGLHKTGLAQQKKVLAHLAEISDSGKDNEPLSAQAREYLDSIKKDTSSKKAPSKPVEEVKGDKKTQKVIRMLKKVPEENLDYVIGMLKTLGK